MARRVLLASPLVFALGTLPLPAEGQVSRTTMQGSSSPQPTIPQSLPTLDVPVSTAPISKPRARHVHKRAHFARHVPPIDRPALANVELLEPLPHPPEPPHVVVPTPAYPLDSLVTPFTTPPPPIVCRPTRYDRFKPDLHLVDQRPVRCTADNP